jgi:hypothetical protein
VNGKFNPKGTLGPDNRTVYVSGPIEFDKDAKVDLLVSVVFDTGEIAVGTAKKLDSADRKWTAMLQSRNGEDLSPGPATGWAAASIVTNEENEEGEYSWRISTYSWDVPIEIVPFPSS